MDAPSDVVMADRHKRPRDGVANNISAAAEPRTGNLLHKSIDCLDHFEGLTPRGKNGRHPECALRQKFLEVRDHGLLSMLFLFRIWFKAKRCDSCFPFNPIEILISFESSYETKAKRTALIEKISLFFIEFFLIQIAQ